MPRKFLPIYIIFLFGACQTSHQPTDDSIDPTNTPNRSLVDSLRIKEAKAYCIKNGYNSNYAFLSNMNIRSGKKRLFVVNLNKDSVIDAGLVAHGHCQSYASRKPNFSNVVGSNCTSLGKYKIGYKYDGSFGTAYKLYGLDSTNSNAFDRFVVLHGHSCVPVSETLVGICRSEGCPTVAPYFLEKLSAIIDESASPILLWVYSD